MAFELGEMVVIVDHHHENLEWLDGRVGMIIGHPKPVVHEGYPFEVLVGGQIVRVLREQLCSFETTTVLDKSVQKNKP